MNVLYLLTESDSDDLFYEACAERITGMAFRSVSRRMRKGSGIAAVRASMRLAVSEIRRMEDGSGVHFIVAMDNDRAPHAAATEALGPASRTRLSHIDLRKCDRYAELTNALCELLGNDRSQWSVPVAVAVPVEMMETWLLGIARQSDAATLPRFARKDSASARHFHQSDDPPPQLKDLCDTARMEDEFQDHAEWILHLALVKLDPDDLAMRATSFALFKQWFSDWPRRTAD